MAAPADLGTPGVAPAEGFAWPVRIYWEDTDAQGIVYYANYLRFFERARTEWWRTVGPAQEAWRAAGLGMFVVSEVNLRYVQPARLDDALVVTVEVLETGRATLLIGQRVLRGDTLLVEGRVRIGWVRPDAQGELRPARLPAEVLQRLPRPRDAAQS